MTYYYARFVKPVAVEVPLLDEDWTPSEGAIKAASLVYPQSRRLVQYWYTLGEIAARHGIWGPNPSWSPFDSSSRPGSSGYIHRRGRGLHVLLVLFARASAHHASDANELRGGGAASTAT
jgi:hypothetical protein